MPHFTLPFVRFSGKRQAVLSPAESQWLNGVAQQQKSPIPMVIITDIGLDPDDEIALTMASGLNRLGVIDLKAVVANMSPSTLRARLAKGVLNMLGMGHVPVAVGSDCNQTHQPHAYEFQAPYLAREWDVLKSGSRLLKFTLDKAPDKSLTVLLISGMTDAARLVRRHGELFRKKVARVVIMGGVESDKMTQKLVPDLASNNTFDPEASRQLYRKLQRFGVPTTFVTRNAAYQAPVSKAFYRMMAQSGSPIGHELRQTVEKALTEWWQKANLPPNHPDRAGVPVNRDRAWFLKAFTRLGANHPLPVTAPIWPHIQKLNLYDPIALLAAVPSLAQSLFTPVSFRLANATHQIIGVNAVQHGIADAQGVRFAIATLVKATLRNALPLAKTEETA